MKKMGIGFAAGFFLGILVLSATAVVAGPSRFHEFARFFVRSGVSVGSSNLGNSTSTSTLYVTPINASNSGIQIEAITSQTGDLFEVFDASDNEVFTIDASGNVAMTGTFSPTSLATYTNGVYVNQLDSLTDVIALHVDGASDTGVDVVSIKQNGSEKVEITSAGVLGAKGGLAITGDLTIDGTAGLDAASVVVDGTTLTFVEGILTTCAGSGCP